MIGCYVRCSTVGQNEGSQRAEITRWLEGNGHADARWYIDKDSGDPLDRPAFRRLQADVFAGKIKTIVVYRLDRISRSLQDGINTLCDWLNRGVRLVATSQQLDFNGITGKLIASCFSPLPKWSNRPAVRDRLAESPLLSKRASTRAGNPAQPKPTRPCPSTPQPRLDR